MCDEKVFCDGSRWNERTTVGTGPRVRQAMGRSTCCPGHPAGHTHLTVLFCLFASVSFQTPPNRFMRIHSLSRVPSKVLASSIHSLAHKSKAWLFIDSVFPVKFAAWESVSQPFRLLILMTIIPVFDISLAISAKNVFLIHSRSLYHKCTHMASNPFLSSLL